MDEFQVREEGVGHVLVEEGSVTDEVECYSVWTVVVCQLSFLSTGEQVGGSKDRGGDRERAGWRCTFS